VNGKLFLAILIVFLVGVALFVRGSHRMRREASPPPTPAESAAPAHSSKR
jgi:Na+-transporting methylmalonyl-CoA/oxaloacetate decarboxylase gamma subunit